MVRPEQIRLTDEPVGAVAATVQSYEYFGHDAVVRVRPAASDLPDLVVRVTGGAPIQPGATVSLAVLGPVVAWPAAPDGPSGSGDAHPGAPSDGQPAATPESTE